MVGFVIVSHSEKLAEGVVDLTKMSAPEAKIATAGGLENGDYGTSYSRIAAAINKIYDSDGVIVLFDLGSAAMTSQMVLEDLALPNTAIIDSPLISAAVEGTILSSSGADFNEIMQALKNCDRE